MDTFFEQLITIKKTAKTWCAYVGIALASIIIMMAAYLFLHGLFIIIAALVLYGAYKLYSMLSIEYEYIITNSSMDIDKIISKSSRKRIMSFDLTTVEQITRYNKDKSAELIKDAVFACNGNEESVFVLVIHPEGKSKQVAVVAPDERMFEAMVKFLPKFVADNIK